MYRVKEAVADAWFSIYPTGSAVAVCAGILGRCTASKSWDLMRGFQSIRLAELPRRLLRMPGSHAIKELRSDMCFSVCPIGWSAAVYAGILGRCAVSKK